MSNYEEWKAIEGYEGYYEVSSLGRVRSLPRTVSSGRGWNYPVKGKILTPASDRGGYQLVTLRKDGQRTLKVHRLVAEAFIPNPLKLPQINHKDGDKTNNRVENLEWCNSKANIAHAWETGLASSNHCSGESHHLSSVQDSHIKECLDLYQTGKWSQRKLAQKYGVSPTTVNNWTHGKTRRVV